MANGVLAIVFVLAGQLSQFNDRYSGAKDQSPPPANNAPASTPDSSVIPILESPPAETSSPSATGQPAGTVTDPYGSAAAPRGSGNTPSSPFERAGPNRSVSSPPNYGTLPARSNEAIAPTIPAASTPGPKPSVLMRAMLTPPAGSRLSGRPVTLAEVVAGGPSRSEQALCVEAYWDLCSSVADYYLGVREQQELQRLRTEIPQANATFQQAEKELAVRVGTSQRAAMASQYRLASLVGLGEGSLPLPGDLPHCGNYQSHYEQIFAGRPAAEAHELSALLPLRYAELKSAAAAVIRAEDWLTNVRRADADGTGSLRALELLALHRRAFVQIARDYNRRIARYVELATPGEIGSERLVARLIMRAGASTATRPSETTPLNRQSGNGTTGPPSTYAEGWAPASDGRAVGTTRDEAVTPASAQASEGPHEERSLLVKPR
jgi:hypothetical protein